MASPENTGRQAGSDRIVAGKRSKPDTIRRYGSLGPSLLPDLVVVARSQNSAFYSSSRPGWRWRVLKISIPPNCNRPLFSTAYHKVTRGNCFPNSGNGVEGPWGRIAIRFSQSYRARNIMKDLRESARRASNCSVLLWQVEV